jgi:hypothetical protein
VGGGCRGRRQNSHLHPAGLLAQLVPLANVPVAVGRPDHVRRGRVLLIHGLAVDLQESTGGRGVRWGGNTAGGSGTEGGNEMPEGGATWSGPSRKRACR